MRNTLIPNATLLRNKSVQQFFPFFLGGSALAVAFIGAALTSDDNIAGGVNGVIERLSGRSSVFLGAISPIGAFAFIAGMVATVNPCGFAMLPAYLGLYLGTAESGATNTNTAHRLGRALVIGLVVTAGVVFLFGITGVIIGRGAQFIVNIFPWVGLSIGIILAIVGAWLLSGGGLYTNLGSKAASHIGNPDQVGIRGYFLFGISYGTASLSCTLPIFLAVVGFSFVGFGEAVKQFILYGLGMGLVIIVLTFGMALFKETMVGMLRKVLPYVQPFSALLLMVAGSYIVYYWLTMGDLIF